MSENDEHQFTLRILKPSEVRLQRTADGDSRTRLTLHEDRSYLDVRVGRAFPFTDPGRYIGFRDMMDADIGIVVDIGELDSTSRDIIARELSRRYFTPRVTKVLSVEDENGVVTFHIMTDRGERRFVVRNLRDNSYSLGPNRIMITDSEGNRYEFPNITTYGPKAYDVLAKVL
jgi:hypothetical protein